MNTLELLSTRLGVLVGIVLVIFLLYKLIRLLRSRSGTYILQENGKFRKEGLVKYDLSKANYAAYDLNRDFADTLVGEVNIDDEDGKVWFRLQKEDGIHLDDGFEKIGYIDRKGNIYDKNHSHVGYVGNAPGQPDMTGRRKWYELFLRCHARVYKCARQEKILSNAGDPESTGATAEIPQDQCVGKCIETGRFLPRKLDSYTVLGRAAAFLLLYRQVRQPKPAGENLTVFRYGWSDTALISAFVFAVLYAVFYLFNVNLISMPFLGDWIVLLPTALYFLVWALLRQVKIEQSLSGKPVEHFLMLFNRNTGLAGVNNMILLFAAAAVGISFFIYGRDFIPFQVAILVGVWVNGKYITKMPWVVYDKFLPPKPVDLPDEGEEETAGMIVRNYRWELDADEVALSGEMDLYFAQDEIDELRNRNPFRTEASQDFKHNIEQLFLEKTDERHLQRINRYISEQAYKCGLGGLEAMQFILDFVQEPNIKYLADEECAETGGIEYARFPVETLFDKHGDCDCKAVLAAALFRNAGYKVAYITSRSHAAIAVACPKEWFSFYNTDKLHESDKKALIYKDGLFYYFCETTSDTFRIGDLGTTNAEEFTEVILLK